MPILHRDIETRSIADLRDVGAWRYSLDPSTDVWCVAFAADDGPIKLWVPGDPIPAEFIEAEQNPDWIATAFNDGFERLIERHILAPRYGFPLVPVERHRCSQAAALALSLPAKLETVAQALSLEYQKDETGHRVMMRMSRPRQPRGGESPASTYWFDDSERRQRLYEYCKCDVAVERELHQHISALIPAEQELWLLDGRINDRGLRIDTQLLDSAIRIADAVSIEINTELSRLTGGTVTSINQPAKLMAWLASQGCEVVNVQKETLTKALTRSNLAADAKRVMELRLDGAHAAAAKLGTMRSWVNGDGRARGTFRFHGASTGRWTSFGIQTQNLKRLVVEDMNAAIAAVATGDLANLRAQYKQPMSVIGDITRALICAAPGHRLIAADLSGIESRVTAWLSGQQSKLDQWSKFDTTHDPADEPYVIIGRRLGFPPEQARAVGKTADLAFGFMGGKGAWRKLAGPDDISTDEEIKQRQQAWRNAHPETIRFWRGLERATVKAIENPGRVVQCKRVAFEYAGDFLFMILPSGRKIAYPFPRLITNERGELAVVFMDNQQGKWAECRHGQGAYGGIWCENAVQAVARDLFAAAMPRLEAAGYPIVLHVHDETVAEVTDGFGSVEEFVAILTTPPDWAAGLPIAAKGRNGPRFAKVETRDLGIGSGPNVELAAADADNPASAQLDAAMVQEHEPPRPRSGNGKGHYSSGEREWGSELAEYIYRDISGAHYLRVVRTSAKQFPQYHRENDRWVKGKPAGPRIPYRLPELLAAPAAESVFICEGEKDVDNVAELGLIATTNPEGAGKWTDDLNKWFAGKQIYILGDNDSSGRAHVAKVAAALHGIVPEIRIVSFPELPEHGDVSDWIEQGGTKTQLLERAKMAKTPQPPHGTYTLVRASDVVPRALDWVWTGHLLRGSLELTTGIPGMGKSQIQCAYVACVTTGGRWPDGSNGIAALNVIMMTAEDCLDQILVPRLIAAKADLGRVHILRKIRKDNKDRMFLLAEDIELLEQMVHDVGDVGLITIDPLTAYMGGKIDSHRVTDVRSQLGPLADLAEQIQVAFSAVTHPAKSAGQRAIDHFIGSQAFIAAARLGHLCVPEMEDDDNGRHIPTGRRLFTNPKHSAYIEMPTLAYRLEPVDAGTDPISEKPIRTAHVVWDEVVGLSADEALAATIPSKSKDHSGPVLFLQDLLLNGPVLATIVEERGVARAFSVDQLRRAKQKLKIVTFKEPKLDGRWLWALPQHAPEKPR
jgi:DNA polymerase bacteriophage-type